MSGARVLLLDDDPHTLDGAAELLRGAGYDVQATATYQEAKNLMAGGRFDLFIADVRLRGYNGLHLVQQCRREHPGMALIVMTGYDEPLIELEARRYDAHFVPKPVRPAMFLDEVASALADTRRRRRWPRTPIAGGFRATVSGAAVIVRDVSYGGVRLEAPGPPLPPAFVLEIASLGLRLPLRVAWTSHSAAAPLYGAVLDPGEGPAARTWCTIVDRLSGAAASR
jgi:CheY-like chemotaxis protein